jgi:leader peptidase (prepilin peptidase)/N-methyltransferase
MLQREIAGQILPLLTVFVALLGTVVGSFLNVVVWRLPRGESLIHPGSHCPKCGHAIRPWENLPILSWIALRARCSQCHLPISIRYPLVELANGLLYLALWWRLWHSGMPLTVLWGYLFLGSALLAASLIDLEHFLIPDAITFTGMVVAALLACVFPETHLGTGLTGLPGGDQLVTGAVLAASGRLGHFLVGHPRLAALADVGLGIAVGYTMLRLLLEAGQRLWGRVRMSVSEPVDARLSAQGLVLAEDELDCSWEDLLTRRGDCFRARAVAVSMPGRIRSEEPGGLDLCVTRTAIVLGDDELPLADIGTVEARLVSWQYPRDVMGHGDLKLLAMIGAFLGPDATVFVLMIAAFLGCAWGLVRAVLRPAQRRLPLPFGPFLASGAVFWTVFGEAFVRWYGRLLTAASG